MATPPRKTPSKTVYTSKGTTTTPADSDFVFTRENYKWMLIGIAVIIAGYFLMAGGGSDDPNVFNPEIFSFRRITLAPMVILIGFGIEIYAILKKPANRA